MSQAAAIIAAIQAARGLTYKSNPQKVQTGSTQINRPAPAEDTLTRLMKSINFAKAVKGSFNNESDKASGEEADITRPSYEQLNPRSNITPEMGQDNSMTRRLVQNDIKEKYYDPKNIPQTLSLFQKAENQFNSLPQAQRKTLAEPLFTTFIKYKQDIGEPKQGYQYNPAQYNLSQYQPYQYQQNMFQRG